MLRTIFPLAVSQATEEPAFPISIAALIVLTLLFAYRTFGKDVYRFVKALPTLFIRIEGRFKKPLQKYFLYYQQLSPKNKRIFEQRVQAFIVNKQFVARQMPKVTSEMKALVAASAVQLTFGLPKLTLFHFQRILLYPDTYYSTIFQRYHKGEVNVKGKLIVLSWKNFVEGYLHPSDGINLGLHEMAHALHLENQMKNQEYNFFDPILLERLEQLSMVEMDRIQEHKSKLFRKYGSVNKHEFFAVAVETFFERANDFRESSPELYETMTHMLRQDPMKLCERN